MVVVAVVAFALVALWVFAFWPLDDEVPSRAWPTRRSVRRSCVQPGPVLFDQDDPRWAD